MYNYCTFTDIHGISSVNGYESNWSLQYATACHAVPGLELGESRPTGSLSPSRRPASSGPCQGRQCKRVQREVHPS